MKTRMLALVVVILSTILGYAQGVRFEKQVFPLNGSVANPNQGLVVHFIDVGAGDAMVIQTPTGKNILIDGGWTRNDKGVGGKYQAYLAQYLKSGIVDLLIISHPDYDHIAGLVDVFDKYAVREVWYSGYTYPPNPKKPHVEWKDVQGSIAKEPDCRFLSPLKEKLGLGGTKTIDDGGTTAKDDDVILTVINSAGDIGEYAQPSGRKFVQNEPVNSSSIVVRLDYGRTSFLFAGDTNGRKENPKDRFDLADQMKCDDQEYAMVERDKPQGPLFGKLAVTVLKVAHHGSDSSNTLPFLQRIHPSWAVISAGTHFSHPRESTLARLNAAGVADNRILRTDESEEEILDEAAPESSIGNDCFVFYVDLKGIAKIEKWSVGATPSQ